jgi:hypothetical protein
MDGRIATITRPRVAQTPVEILRDLQEELFPSVAFRAWLAAISRLVPMRHAAKARRFRPGLDYTLATSEENEARLDVVLDLTPVPEEPADSAENSGWQSGEWGGWDVSDLFFCFDYFKSYVCVVVSVTWHLMKGKTTLLSTVLVHEPKTL